MNNLENKDLLSIVRNDMLKIDKKELHSALSDLNIRLSKAKRVDLLYMIVILGAKVRKLEDEISDMRYSDFKEGD